MKPPPKKAKTRPARRKPAAPTARVQERRLGRLVAAHAAEMARQERRLAALRRAHDRRIATLVQEIAHLRHHEARSEALTRLLADRDRRIAELESLLQMRTELG